MSDWVLSKLSKPSLTKLNKAIAEAKKMSKLEAIGKFVTIHDHVNDIDALDEIPTVLDA
jgi:hypothetical protein